MNFAGPLSDVILFELLDFEEATELCRRLAMDWFTWVQSADGHRSVAVVLVPDEAGLAVLLRTVQRWIGEHGRGAISFELDGRRYALPAAEPTPLAA